MAKGDGYLLVGTRTGTATVTISVSSGEELLITDYGDSSSNFTGFYIYDNVQSYQGPFYSGARYGTPIHNIMNWGGHGRGKDKAVIITNDIRFQLHDDAGSGSIYYWITGVYTK